MKSVSIFLGVLDREVKEASWMSGKNGFFSGVSLRVGKASGSTASGGGV